MTVGPNSTQIKLTVGFQTMDQVLLTHGKGTVTINTEGMFSLQAQGKLVGIVNAKTLKLDVAWNPLDVLFAGELEYTNFLSGSFGMHGWVGQGWQNKYNWLPDNNSFHFTGTIKGTVKIPKGELINKKYFKLPPFTASISVKVAFGEFCTNSGCTSYKWGMSATVEVFGYDVGLYVDSGGPDLILGTSSHKLIDQFGSSSATQKLAFAEETHFKPDSLSRKSPTIPKSTHHLKPGYGFSRPGSKCLQRLQHIHPYLSLFNACWNRQGYVQC